MSIEGSINVSALFHDKDGTTAMKVVSLRSSNEYTTGKVAIITGTAGTAAVVVMGLEDEINTTSYRDASGALVTFENISRVAFSWSGSNARTFTPDADGGLFKISSASGRVSVADHGGLAPQPTVSAGQGTGTYTIVVYGT